MENIYYKIETRDGKNEVSVFMDQNMTSDDVSGSWEWITLPSDWENYEVSLIARKLNMYSLDVPALTKSILVFMAIRHYIGLPSVGCEWDGSDGEVKRISDMWERDQMNPCTDAEWEKFCVVVARCFSIEIVVAK